MEDSCSHLPGNYKGLLEEVEKEKITKSSSAGGGGGDDDDDHHHVSVDEFNKGENDQRGMIKQAEESSSKLPRPPSPHNKKHSTIIKDQDQQEQVESTKAKMGEVREENERLKLLLSQIVKDYKSLEMRFLDILQQEEAKKSLLETAPSHQENKDDEESDDLVSLSLGRSSDSQEAKKEEKKSSNNGKELDEKMNHNNNELALGLGCKFELPFAASTAPAAEKDPSSESSFGKAEEEDATEMCPPTKILKTADQRNGDNDQQSSEQMQVKKTRVSIRARCDTPTMNDGCQWRKYGQKIAKGNPCPRAYYRCTVSPTCPVRKQVQRCSEDMSILITTYEGNHNHPLPLSATAMASTTSAAASMLQSQSSSSQPGVGSSVSAAASTSTSSNQRLHGLDINFSQNSRHPYQYYFPNSTVSTSNSHPTITLDLTAPVNSSYFNRLSNAPRYSASSSTTLNFSSSSSNSLERSWNSAGLFNHGAFPNLKNSLSAASNIGGRQPTQEHLYQSYMQTTNETTIPQQALSETITAATKVITSNPSFCSALAAALTSFIGNGGDVPRENLHSGNTAQFRAAPDQNEVGCASSYLARSSPMNSHQQHQKQGSLLLFPSSLPFPTSNETSSGSPADNCNHLK